jgi:excisionase family DNA binding protein
VSSILDSLDEYLARRAPKKRAPFDVSPPTGEDMDKINESIVTELSSLPLLLTVAEVAEVLRVAPQTVRRLIRDGKIKTPELGQQIVRIPRGEVARALGLTSE